MLSPPLLLPLEPRGGYKNKHPKILDRFHVSQSALDAAPIGGEQLLYLELTSRKLSQDSSFIPISFWHCIKLLWDI
jgi:hypothetical protein